MLHLTAAPLASTQNASKSCLRKEIHSAEMNKNLYSLPGTGESPQDPNSWYVIGWCTCTWARAMWTLRKLELSCRSRPSLSLSLSLPFPSVALCLSPSALCQADYRLSPARWYRGNLLQGNQRCFLPVSLNLGHLQSLVPLLLWFESNLNSLATGEPSTGACCVDWGAH